MYNLETIVIMGTRERDREKEKARGVDGVEEERMWTVSQLQLVLIVVHDTFSWLLVHYKSLLSVIETDKSKSKDQATADASSYITLCYSNSIFILVAVMLQYALGYIRPLSILLQSKSRGSRTCFAFSGHTIADSETKFRDLYLTFPSQMKMTFCRQSQ